MSVEPMPAVSVVRSGSAALVTLRNPPVNAIGLAVRQGLADALDWVEAQQGLTRVILTGSDRAFAAGGDAREFDAPPQRPHLPEIIDRIESCDVPWIAAITGVALGGGCELALGCRYRIAVPGARLGLPEVSLGVVPGAGGTQRLPRLIGVARALDLIATGKPVTAAHAERIGLIDGIADDPQAVASGLDIGSLSLAPVVGELPAPVSDVAALAEARAQAERRMAHQIAPLRAIELVEAATRLPFADGLARERATFLDLRSGAQSRALRHVFFAERAAKAPAWIDAAPLPLKQVAVAGGGTMGAGIAYALLSAGLDVVLIESDADGVARARENVDGIVTASLRRGFVDEADATALRARLKVTAEVGEAAGATLAIEAAFESMAVKAQVFAALDAHLPPQAILATNTSYLDINAIAGAVHEPSRVLGLHFFAPAHVMKLLEIVRGDATSDAALATGFALARRLRKVPVLAGVCDGFIGNRILARYREAADTLLMDATNPWELDEAMVGFGYAMGPYETQDLSGLDIAHANRRRQDATRDPRRRYVPIQDRMVAEGRLGRKTGVGWYRYPGGGGKVIDPLVEDLVREEAHFAKVTRHPMTDDDIRERLLLAMINEAADILHEGIAASPGDIDLVSVFGYGFPRWRGGLMHYADTLGARAICDRLSALAVEDPVAWRASPLLERCADSGTKIGDYRPE